MNDARLGDVASFIRGITFKPEDVVPLETPRAVACMRTKNVQSELDLSDVWGVRQDLVKRDDQYLIDGDILVSSANSWNLVGKCCAVPTLPQRSTFGGFVSVLRPQQEKLDPRYLFRWFSSGPIQKTVRSFGQQTTNISNLNIERCLALAIPLPSLAEQRRIAEILDKADALRAKRRAALAQLDTLTQSIFVDMFGDPVGNSRWPVASLGSVLTSMRYGPRFYDEEYAEDGIRIVRITDLSEGGSLDYKAMPKLRVAAQDFEKSALRPGDVIFARSGATVGKTALIRNEDPPSIAGAYFIVLRFDERFDPVYADAVLRCPSVRAIVTRRSRQAAQQNFSGPGLRELPFPVPPSDLQREFSCKVTAVARTIRTNEASASGMDALFASIQHRAFRCEL
jgi:type I restriction enzyme S subunit